MKNSHVDLNRIQLFLEIVRIGSITRTAELFNLQKSKVSRDLALLEQELGSQLIYRTTRQFNLTIEGQKFYEKANESLKILNEAINEASSGAKTIAGPISITSPEDIGEIILMPLLEEFTKLYPDITFNIDFSTDLKDLVANKVDLAIRPGNLKDSSLIMKKIGIIDFGLYCSNAKYNSLPEIHTPQQLSDLPTITFQQGFKQPSWHFKYKNKTTKVNLNPLIQVNSYLAVHKLIQKGMGIGLLPSFIAKSESSKSDLVEILKDYKISASNLQIIYPQRNEDITRVRVLTDFLRKKIATSL